MPQRYDRTDYPYNQVFYDGTLTPARYDAWLHRLAIRYERHAHLFCAFLTLAAALTCYKKLTK